MFFNDFPYLCTRISISDVELVNHSESAKQLAEQEVAYRLFKDVTIA